MMRKYFIPVFIILMFFVLDAKAVDTKIPELEKKKLPEVQIPKINIKTLPNGIKIYYLKDTELPVFQMNVYFDEVGALYEEKSERGLNSIFMNAWRSGGSKKYTPDAFDEKLAFTAASISASSGSEYSSLKMGCLQKDTNETLDLFFDVLRNPLFNADRLDVFKKAVLNSISQRNEKAISVAGREFMQSLYGEDSPLAWSAIKETIQPIDGKMLKQYYQDNIALNRMRIAGSSPLEFDEFLALIDPYLKGWSKKREKKPYPTKVKKEWKKSTEFIHKPGNQSAIIIGHFGEKRFTPDKFKLVLANEILGGTTFGSKLGDRIRTDLGLAYSINSNFGFGTDYGAFTVMTQTKSESTVNTIEEIQKIITKMVDEEDVTQAEIDLAKERIINRLIFEYDSPFNIVVMELNYNYHGYPPNYLQVYQRELAKVTLKDVKSTLKKYFFPNQLKTMIVGDKTKIQNIEKLGEVANRPLDFD
jgi:zinc protease